MISDPAIIAAAGNTWDAASGSGNRYLQAIDPTTWPMPAQVTTAQSALTMTSEAAKFVMAVNHDGGPLPTRSTKNGEALVMVEPFVTMLRNHSRPTRVGEPLAAVAAGGYHQALTTPPGAFISDRHCGWTDGDPSMNNPLPTMPGGTHSLVVPFRRGARPHRTAPVGLYRRSRPASSTA